MQLSMKFAVLAVLAQVSIVFASPIGDVEGDYGNHLVARAPKKVPTQADCEASCNMLLLAGQITQAQWPGCVSNCLGVPTPPPTPPQQRPVVKPVVKKQRVALNGRAPKKVPTQADCEASCTMLVLAGQITQAQWQGCVSNCLGVPTPPPTPPQQRLVKPVVKKPQALRARAPKKVPTQAECEAGCNLLLLSGQITQAQWQGCVSNCLGVPTPPPTPPQQRPAVRPVGKGKKARSVLNERAPKKVPTQADCEASCTMLVLAGQITQAQWQGCVSNCLGVPTPPPTPPQQRPAVRPVGKGKKARSVLNERAPKKVPTQADCEASCTMLVLAGQITQAQWQGCVSNCLGVPTPPPTPPQQKPAARPAKVGGRAFEEDEE